MQHASHLHSPRTASPSVGSTVPRAGGLPTSTSTHALSDFRVTASATNHSRAVISETETGAVSGSSLQATGVAVSELARSLRRSRDRIMAMAPFGTSLHVSGLQLTCYISFFFSNRMVVSCYLFFLNKLLVVTCWS